MSARHRVFVTRLHIRIGQRPDFMGNRWQLGVGIALGALLGVLALLP